MFFASVRWWRSGFAPDPSRWGTTTFSSERKSPVSMRREVNAYLFFEFGFDDAADEEAVTESWPFVLESLGRLDFPGRSVELFRFTDDDEVFYATGGDLFDVFRAAGMEPRDLQTEALGSRWVAEREPVDLHTARPDDPTIPRSLERRAAIGTLIQDRLSVEVVPRILEGIYLQKSREYLALVADPVGGSDAVLITARTPPQRVEFAGASPHRRLSIAVGRLLEAGVLPA
jgi:hypothetical protein